MATPDQGPQNEADVFTRPSEQHVRQAWSSLFDDPLLSMNTLKSRAVSGLAEGLELEVDNWVPLRSLHWKLHHAVLPSPSPALFTTPLATSRATYDSLRARYLRAPDGRWAADVSVPDGAVLVDTGKGRPAGHDLGKNNPLSLEEENPWTSWFSDVDLRKVIRQDVERTFPDVPYFTIPRVQTLLTTLLFLYSVLHPDVGYRQGMHELAAAILLVVDLDSIPSSTEDDLVSLTLSREYVEHDTWTLYEAVMKHAKGWYQWREEEASISPPLPLTGFGGPRQPPKKLEQPIVTICNHMHSTLLRSLDPQLWAKMEELGIEPQIYGIRWIRLIFTREFSLDVSLRLWDGLFASDHTLRLVEFICIAMLLRIRNSLVNADYSIALSTLLRYPTLNPPLSIPLLLTQALALRDSSASPATGVAIVMQNEEVLGIPAKPPLADEQEYDTPRRGGGGRRPPPLQAPPVGAGRIAQVQMGIAGLGLGDVAKGLLERGQALGIDKAILSRVTEIRKNLPDFPTSPSAARPQSFSPSSSYTNLTTSTQHHQASLRLSSDLSAELLALRATMQQMSLLVGRCVEGIERELSARPSTQEDEGRRPSAAGEGVLPIGVALSGLRMVREALRDPGVGFDAVEILGHGYGHGKEQSAEGGDGDATGEMHLAPLSTSTPARLMAPDASAPSSVSPPPSPHTPYPYATTHAAPPPPSPLAPPAPSAPVPLATPASTPGPATPALPPPPPPPPPPPTPAHIPYPSPSTSTSTYPASSNSSPYHPSPPPPAHPAPPHTITSRARPSSSLSSQTHSPTPQFPSPYLSGPLQPPSTGLSRPSQQQSPRTPLPNAIGFGSHQHQSSGGQGKAVPPPPWVRTTSSFSASTGDLPQFPQRSSWADEVQMGGGGAPFSRFAGGPGGQAGQAGGVKERGSRDPLVGERPAALMGKTGSGLTRVGASGGGGGDPLGAL